jgi:hypothetical protein
MLKPHDDWLLWLDILQKKHISIWLLASSFLNQQTVVFEVIDLIWLTTQLILHVTLFSLEVIDFSV